MAKIRIFGSPELKLEGSVRISGAKNAVLPAIAAGILTGEEIKLTNIPLVKDVYTILTLIEGLGGKSKIEGNRLTLHLKKIISAEASYDLVRAMRASILVLGPLLARKGIASVAMPGGCAIGSRPIDLHLYGLQKLGAEISIEHGYIHARAKKLRGTEIEFEKKTVGGTENLTMAAVLADGVTILRNCAFEPEVMDLVLLLRKMGADIAWLDEETLKIRGVKELCGAEHEVIPDRIEAGTFMVAGALTNGNILLTNARPDHLQIVVEKLRVSGVTIDIEDGKNIRVIGGSKIKPQDITTSPYPGFPTDMQAQFIVLLTQAEGTSIITETIYDRRFQHVNELLRLGASIEVLGDKAIVKGKTSLSGAEVVATDLRAAASLVLAGMIAHGETVISEAEHIDRGYENFEQKLRNLGVRIERMSGDTG